MVEAASNRHTLKQQRREERERALAQEQEAHKIHHRTKKVKKYTFLGIGLIIVISLLIFFISSVQSKPGPYDAFAQCLTDKGAVMYGAYWCPHCANQKKFFGSSFKHVTYVECDPKGSDAQPELCLAKGVQSYPTWEINGEMQSGEMPLPVLAEKSGCVLP